MFAVIVIVFLVFVYWMYYSRINAFLVKSNVDNMSYKVHAAYGKPKNAANTLAMLNKTAVDLLKHLKKKYKPHDKNSDSIIKSKIRFLLKNYDPDNIVENAPDNIHKSTSYTQNKGELLAMCLRPRDPNDNNDVFHNDNILKFVLIHEMAHMMTYEYGHGRGFWINFKFLLQEAVEAGIYKPVSYRENPINYCGMDVDYNPLYDPRLPSLV